MPSRPDSADSNRSPYSGRSHYRSQNHNEAHADEALVTPPSHAHHPLATKDAPHLVAKQTGLNDLVSTLRSAGSFAYDSEFIGELTYIPKLCLIQVATSKSISLIDPLADLDLTPFWELVADPAVEKIVHAGDQDVEPVFRHLNKPPANLFDTQIAAGFIGMGYPLSLSKLVYAMLGAKLAKGLTFTHWDHRPLSNQQLRYAADDVRYLPALREEMRTRLEALGHTRWANEESGGLANPALYQFDPQTQFLKIRGAGNLSPQNMAVLRELTNLRNELAQRENVPPRSLLKDEVLLEMARNPVHSVDALAKVRGLPHPVETAHGPQIVAATARALTMKGQQLPVNQTFEPTPVEKFSADSLWAVVQCVCAGRGIDPTLVTSRQEVGEFLRANSAGEDSSACGFLQGWRREALGDAVLSLLRGEIRLTSTWNSRALATRTEKLG